MPFFSVDDIRKSWGQEWSDASDTEVINAYARAAKVDPTQVAIELGFAPGAGGKNAKRLSSSVDRYQANLYGVGEEVAGTLGLNRARDWMRSGREENELQANVASARAQMMGATDRFKDVHSLSDFGDYAAGLGIQSLPYLAEAAAGGVGGRMLMGGTRAALGAARTAGDVEAAAAASRRLAAGQTAGAVAASYPSSVGDILENQREQAGTTDFGTAAALGLPYAGLNALGVEGALARGQLYRSGIRALDEMRGIRGGLSRMGATGVRAGLVEGGTETAQEGLNQAGRMAVDPNETFINPRSMERFGESFVGGAVLGGGIGAGAGGWRRSAPQNLLPNANPPREEPGAPALPPNTVAFEPGLSPVGPPAPPSQFQPGAGVPYESGLTPVPPMGTQMAPGAVIPSVGEQAYWQGDLFNPLYEGANPQAAPQEAPPVAPAADPYSGDLFAANPSAMVRTEFGIAQIRGALRQANGGKVNAQLSRFIPEFSRALEEGPDAVMAVIEKYDGPKLTMRADVLETAAQIADDYQRRMQYAMASEGLGRAQPGVRVGQAPVSTGTEEQMRQRNQQEAAAEARAAQQGQGAMQFESELESADARVQQGREQETAAKRRAVLDQALDGAQNPGNARNRFIKALRKAGLKDAIVRPDEQEAIRRYFDTRAAFADEERAAPNEMAADLVREKQPPQAQKTPRTKRERAGGPELYLTSPPSTQADLDALEKAQARRARRAGQQEAQQEDAAPEAPNPRQGKLFTSRGKPTKAADQAPPEPKAKPEPTAPAKPKTVTLKNGVEVSPENRAVYQQEIDKYKAFIDCLTRKK